jgi:hypothetical protein
LSPHGPAAPASAKGAGLADELVAECIAAWTRALRTYRELRTAHPLREGVCESLTTLLRDVLQTHGALHFQVTLDGLLREGRSLSLAGRTDHSLPALLHGAGIRELFIEPSPDRAEVDAMLDVLGKDRSAGLAQDLASALWEANLPHLRFVSVPPVQLIPTPRPPAHGLPMWPPCGVPVASRPRTRAPRPNDENEEADDWTVPNAMWIPPLTLPDCDRFDQVRLRVEVEEATQGDPFGGGLPLISHLIGAQADEEELGGSVSAVGTLITHLLDRGALREAHAVLASAQQALHMHPAVAGLPGASRDHLWGLLLDPQAVARGVRAWENHPEPDFKELQGLIDEIEEPSADALCEMLLHSGMVKLRRHACHRLIQVCATCPDRLRPWLQRTEWYVARNVAYVLANIPGNEAEEMLLQLVHHEDGRVRQECVAALAASSSVTAREAVIEMTEDAEPSLRLPALRALRNARDPILAGRLQDRAKDRSFGQLPVEERVALIGTIGAVGGPQAIPLLESLLCQPSPLDRRESDPISEAAAGALVALETPEAHRALQRAAKSWSRPVKSAAEKALRDHPVPPEPEAEG